MTEEKNSIKLNEQQNTGSAVDPESGEDYDPHKYRKVHKPTTDVETLIHILKGALGTGILAMPEAFKNAGYVSGIISTCFIGFLCVYCLQILIRSQYILCKRHRVPLLTYPISMKLALEAGPPCLRWLANPSIWIVDSFLITFQLGICCVYIVFVASNIKQIVDFYAIELDIKIHILFLIIPFMLIFLIRNLKLLAPFSQFANIMTFIGCGMICYYIFQEMPPIKDRHMIAHPATYPLFFGTVLFALEAVGVMVSLEANMKNPKHFGGYFGVFNIGMTIIVVMYVLMGFFGYLKYGDGALGSITLNIPEDKVLSQVIKMFFTVAVFISYALQGYVPVEIIWLNYLKKRYGDSRHALLYEYLVRFGVIFITFFFAILVPRLGLFISLFGALCMSILGLLFPALMEICVLYPNNYGKFNYILFKGGILIIMSFIGFCAGTYTSIRDIILTFF